MRKLTEYTIIGLIGAGIVIALLITQAIFELDLLPKEQEKYVYGLTAAFCSLIFFMFLASFINELYAIKKILESKKSENDKNHF